MTFNIRNRNQDSRNLCCSNQMLTFLSEFSSLIKKFIILLVPGMAKNTFCRLLGFSQTELRQPRKNSPAGVRLSTSKVGRMCSALFRAVSESPEGRCAWASLGLCPSGQVWAWEQPDRSLKHWAPWSGLLYCFHFLLPDVGVPFTSLPGSPFLKSTRLSMAALGLRCCMQDFLRLWQLEAALQLRCTGFSLRRRSGRALGMRASEVAAHALSSCGSGAPEHGLSGCGSQA